MESINYKKLFWKFFWLSENPKAHWMRSFNSAFRPVHLFSRLWILRDWPKDTDPAQWD